ncbi:MAG TPA: hypothetical protein VKA85_06085 [Candidatus Limnocylindrales bacterium]|nr:hypothetical protein [Candidatus Limnocylindrales bacterium]
MQRAWQIASALIAVIGMVFIGQGIGFLRGSSFMVGDRTWAVVGAVLVALGVGLAWRTSRATTR